MLALNLLVLLPASLLPWPAAVVGAAVREGDHHDQVVAVLVYASVACFVPLTLAGLYTYLARVPRLLETPGDADYCRRVARSGLVSALSFPLAALAALFAPVAALVIFVAVPALFLGALLLRTQARTLAVDAQAGARRVSGGRVADSENRGC